VKRTLILVLIIVLFLITAATAAIKFTVNHKSNIPRITDDAVVHLVDGALNLNKSTVPYYRSTVNIYAIATGEIDHCVVYLFRSDTYTTECYRLDVSGDTVTKITLDYYEPEDTDEQELCGTCPDSTVEALFSYIAEGFFPGAFLYGNQAYNDAMAAGVKAVILHGVQETKQTVLNYLACPKLVTWGRIGHGMKTHINLSDNSGSISATEITQMADQIKDRVFVFNSCWCHNDPFESAMIGAGVRFFAGGDIALSGGNTGKEAVFARFYKKAIAGKKELEESLQEAITETDYPNAWGWSGANPGPYYMFSSTAINGMNAASPLSFSIIVKPESVVFNTEGINHSSSIISIFNPTGRLIQKNTVSQGSFSWDLTGSNGALVSNGPYIVIINDGTSSLKRIFSITK